MKQLIPLLLASVTGALAADADIAPQPAHVIVSPWKQHIPPTKRQGVPGIECTAQGRLWAVFGRDVESTRNFQGRLWCSCHGQGAFARADRPTTRSKE